MSNIDHLLAGLSEMWERYDEGDRTAESIAAIGKQAQELVEACAAFSIKSESISVHNCDVCLKAGAVYIGGVRGPAYVCDGEGQCYDALSNDAPDPDPYYVAQLKPMIVLTPEAVQNLLYAATWTAEDLNHVGERDLSKQYQTFIDEVKADFDKQSAALKHQLDGSKLLPPIG